MRYLRLCGFENEDGTGRLNEPQETMTPKDPFGKRLEHKGSASPCGPTEQNRVYMAEAGECGWVGTWLDHGFR